MFILLFPGNLCKRPFRFLSFHFLFALISVSIPLSTFVYFFFHCKFLSFSSLFFSYHRGTVTATLPTLDDQLFTVLFICICVNTNRGENKYVSIWSGHDLISLCNLNQVLLTNVHVFRDKN